MNPSTLSPYLRRLSKTDIIQVTAIEQESFSDPWSAIAFHDLLKDSPSTYPLVLAIPSTERIIGYLIFWRVDFDLHIGNLAVHSDFRRQGWAEKLLQTLFFLGHHWSIKHYLLEVRQSNRSARRLYDKLGFRILSIRRNYYQNPLEDALVLCLDRSPEVPNPLISLHSDVLLPESSCFKTSDLDISNGPA